MAIETYILAYTGRVVPETTQVHEEAIGGRINDGAYTYLGSGGRLGAAPASSRGRGKQRLNHYARIEHGGCSYILYIRCRLSLTENYLFAYKKPTFVPDFIL
jgi:Uri superfamily endonuclease